MKKLTKMETLWCKELGGTILSMDNNEVVDNIWEYSQTHKIDQFDFYLNEDNFPNMEYFNFVEDIFEDENYSIKETVGKDVGNKIPIWKKYLQDLKISTPFLLKTAFEKFSGEKVSIGELFYNLTLVLEYNWNYKLRRCDMDNNESPNTFWIIYNEDGKFEDLIKKNEKWEKKLSNLKEEIKYHEGVFDKITELPD
jgi:hypothetical protein